MRFHGWSLSAACLILATTTRAQQVAKAIDFSGTPKCVNCGVRLQEVATLGDDANGPGRLEIGAYAFDRKRKLAYVRGASRSEVNAYDLKGKLQFTVGVRDRRPPAGARDYSFGVGSGDSLWVLDPGQQRVTIYQPGTATAARSFRVKNRIERILPLKDGQFVGITSSAADTPDHALVHLFAADGKPAVALGGVAAAAGARPAVGLSRNASMVWIARPDSYTIELWGLDGKQYSTARRVSTWLTPEAIAKAKKEHRTQPAITDVYEDAKGALWVLGRKPDPTFRRPTTKTAAATRTPDYLNVLEVLNAPSQTIEFADEVGLPLYRLGEDYFVQPNENGHTGTWRVVKVSLVKR